MQLVPGLKFLNVHMPNHEFEIINVRRLENQLAVRITNGQKTYAPGSSWVENDWNTFHTEVAFKRGEYYLPKERADITLEDVRLEEAIFSDEAFGKNRSFTGPLNHLKKEIQEVIDADNEVAYDPTNGSLIEFADCLLLLMDAFRLCHKDLTAHDLLRACMNKIAINKKRKWGKPDANGVIEHVRDEDKGAMNANTEGCV